MVFVFFHLLLARIAGVFYYLSLVMAGSTGVGRRLGQLVCFITSRLPLAVSTGVCCYLSIVFGWINWCDLIPLACLWLDQLVCVVTSRLSLVGSTGVF